MQKIHKVFLSAAVALSFTAILIASRIGAPAPFLGNISSYEAMQSTTTGPFTGVRDGKVLCSSGGVLGSVQVTGPVYNSQFYILDATTTDVVNGNAIRAATSSLILVDITKPVPGNATTTGDLPLNSIARTGIIIGAFGNSLATTTITYRCN